MYSLHNPELFELFLEQAPIATAMCDRQMRYLCASRQWLSHCGISSGDIAGRYHYEIFPNLKPNWYQLYQRCLAGAKIHYQEENFIRADGMRSRVNWLLQPWRQASGDIGGVMLSAELLDLNLDAIPSALSPISTLPCHVEITPQGTIDAQIAGAQLEWQYASGTLSAGQQPAVLMWLDTALARLMAGLQAMVGTKRFNLALQSEGRKSIEPEWAIASQYPDFNEGFTALAQLAPLAGWGNWQLHKIDWERQECVFRIYNSWEGRYQTSLNVCWGSSFMAGKLAGYCSQLFATNCQAEQIAFIANGDLYDEFFVRPAEQTIEAEIEQLLATDAATRADMVVALRKLQAQIKRANQIQAVLHESETHYRMLMEQASDGIFILSCQGQLLKVNSMACQMLGYDAATLVQLSIDCIVASNELPALLKHLADVLAGKTIRIESQMQRQDGTIFPVELSANMLDSGQIQAIARDITERKQVEAALRESEAKFQKLAANIPGVIYQYRLQPDGQSFFSYVSPGCRELCEVEPEVFYRYGCFSLVCSEDREPLIASLNEAICNLQPWHWEWRITTPSGKLKWVQGSSRPEIQPNGDVIWDGLFMDITNVKQAQANLAEAQKLAHIGSWEFNLISEKISWSEELFRIYGLDPQLGEPSYPQLRQMIHADSQETWETTIARVISLAQPQEFQHQIIRPDGTIRCLHAQAKAILDHQNQVVKIFGTALDITERQQAEAALRHYQEHLEELVAERTTALHTANQQLCNEIAERKISEMRERAKAIELEQTLQELQRTQFQLIQNAKMSSLGQLVAGVAHEINNPVNFIYGNLAHTNEYTQELLSLIVLYQQHYPQPAAEIRHKLLELDFDFLSVDLSKMLASMKVGAERIRKIVQSLRNFSRLDEAESKKVDIHEGIESTISVLKPQLNVQQYRPEINVIKNYGQLPEIECYPGQLNQVFMHLLSNAIDALDEKDRNRSIAEMSLSPSTIRISTELQHSKVIIRIADSGIGIPDAAKQRLFDPFFTTKPVGQGTGLGLSTCYQIVVEKHGGQFHCWSEFGQGTEFALEIPLHQVNSNLPRSI